MGVNEGHPDPPTARLTEEQIRPEALRAEQQRRFASDVQRLVEGIGSFVPVDCPACGEHGRRPAFDKMGIDYVICEYCGTMYVSPRPTPEQLAEYYRTSENYRFWAEHVFPASETARLERIVRPRLGRLLSVCDSLGVGRGRLVEVGPGFGTFCQEAARSGAFTHVVAVEPTPSLASACKERGVEVVESRIEDVDIAQLGVPDVVVAFEVIEHLFDPGAFIDSCRRLLPADGLLVLSCPSAAGFDVQVLGAASDTVDAEHLNYFTPRSLPLLLDAHGFEVLDVQTPGELDAELVRNKAAEGAVSLAEQPFLEQVLIDEWDRLGGPFQTFLASHLLSSHLWVAARPR